MAEENVTPAFIGMHLECMTIEVASPRDDMRVMAAILQQDEERPFPDPQDTGCAR